MTRYQALRTLCGCDPLTAWFIATLNDLRGVPPGLIGFMHIVMEYDHESTQ